jgi:2-succinyl-5-enolpyruvyl-6-hydroxy-3-cyclohexene-1-carboxylate synthase
MSEDPGLLTEWARLLLGCFAQAGVTEVVISPGSRSTPFAIAALRTPGLTCHSVVDERAAGFFALAQGRLCGRPSLLLCTSGSAPAHYLPAVIEAARARVPLLILSADRPFELQDAEAPQTIDQQRLFGVHARAYVELGDPAAQRSTLASLPRRVAQALASAQYPEPGAVHVNARARKPLEPRPAAPELSRTVDALLARGVPRLRLPRVSPEPEAIRELADACRRFPRGVITVGSEAPCRALDQMSLEQLAALTGYPVISEIGSQQRTLSAPEAPVFIDTYDALLSDAAFAAEIEPELVIQVGNPLVASSAERLLGAHTELWVLTAHGVPDPFARAHAIVLGSARASVEQLVRELAATEPARAAREAESAAWLGSWLRAANAAARELGRELDGAPADALDEGTVTRAVLRATRAGGALVLGNSLPVRHAEYFAARVPDGVSVLVQRGASGIDGLVAGAMGAAALGRPTSVLLGDVSLLHDASALALASLCRAPLRVVVLNNLGGRIFDQLPVRGAVSDAERRFWTTPHALSFEALARFYELAYVRASTRAELAAALDRAEPKLLIEAVVSEDAYSMQRERFGRALRQALATRDEAC